MSNNSRVTVLTEGNPFALIIRFAIPLILSSFFQQLYNFVDTAIVGRCLGVEALSAVGVTASLYSLVLGFTMGSAVGFCIPLSQAVGAGKEEEVNPFFWNGLYLSSGISIVVSIFIMIFIEEILIFMKTPEELFPMAAEYLKVIILGQFITILYNYFAGVIRALGDSKRPFYFLMISSVINVILDLLFIQVFHIGVQGAAAATVISQAVSALLCGWWLFAKMNVIRKEEQKPSFYHMKKMALIGIPMGLEHSVTYVGAIVLQGAINTLGSIAVAAQICGEKIRRMITLPFEGVGMAMATYTGQNYGAAKMDRVKQGIRSGLIIQICYCVIAWSVLFILKKPMVALLLGESSSLEAQGAIQYLTIITPLCVFHGCMMVFRNVLQGMGHGMSAMFSGAAEVAARVGASLLAVSRHSFVMIALANPFAWAAAMVYCMVLDMIYIKKEDDSCLWRWTKKI